jgi:hypothetical protein
VQEERSAAMLADWGCDYMQGAFVGLASLDRPFGPTGTASIAGA